MRLLWIGGHLFLCRPIWTVRTKTSVSVLGSVSGKKNKSFLLFLKCTSSWQQTEKSDINCWMFSTWVFLVCLFQFVISYLLQKQASKLINLVTSANLESKQKGCTHRGNNIQTKHFPECAYVSDWFFFLTSVGTAILVGLLIQKTLSVGLHWNF